MNFSGSALAAGFVFGVFGYFLMRSGRRSGDIPRLFIGLALMIYPYFIENIYLLWGLGLGLCVLAYRKI